MRRRKYPATRGSREGFTLLELLVVLTLLSILTSAVVPVYYGSLRSVQGDHTIRDLVAVLRYAGERAVTDTMEYRVYFDARGGAFWIERWTERIADDGTFVFKKTGEPYGDTHKISDLLTLDRVDAREDKQRGLRYIQFYPGGSCDIATINLKREDGTRVEIKTLGTLGRIALKEHR